MGRIGNKYILSSDLAPLVYCVGHSNKSEALNAQRELGHKKLLQVLLLVSVFVPLRLDCHELDFLV